MRFEVERTSFHEGPPCEGAEAAMFPTWDRRTSKSPEHHDALMAERFGGSVPPWLSEGSEHHVEPGGGIARRRGDREGWTIELADLDALVEFVGKHGDVVVQSVYRSLPRIEIYDDYRE